MKRPPLPAEEAHPSHPVSSLRCRASIQCQVGPFASLALWFGPSVGDPVGIGPFFELSCGAALRASGGSAFWGAGPSVDLQVQRQ